MAAELQILSTLPPRAQSLATIVEAAGYHAVTTPTIEGALQSNALERTEVLIIDSTMGLSEQHRILSESRRKSPSTQILLLVGKEQLPEAQQAASAGAYWIVAEPFENEDLLNALARATVLHHIAKGKQVAELNLPYRERSNETTGEIIALAPSMQRLLMRLQRMAPLSATVLLTGESGTGKTYLASLIHQLSPRKHAQFHSLSCANLPRELLESELFGHEKGAFTGANSSKPGLIELCDGGTLFLDELGELPLDLQPKLLTFLQDHRVRRLGGKSSKLVNVRVICATNRNLTEMVQQGEFREDLFFRVNVLNVKVPALRERIEDIDQLADRIMARINREQQKNSSIAPASRALMRSYRWPGNIRELEHVLERAIAFSDSGTIEPEDLELFPNPGPENIAQPRAAQLAGRTLKSVEEQLIRETLELCQGDKTKAALMLGVSLKTIYNKLRSFH